MGVVSLISAIYFLYFQCISILSYNPNQSNANFNIEKKRLAAPASSHRKPLNALRGSEQNLGTGATGDLPSELEHTQALLPCYQRYQLYPKSCWCRCNRRPPLKIGAHKHCYHVINDINCVQNLMLMYVQQAESPPNEIRSLKICHHPILGLQLMQWLQ